MPEQRYIAIDEGEYVRIVTIEEKEDAVTLKDMLHLIKTAIMLIMWLVYIVMYDMTHALDR